MLPDAVGLVVMPLASPIIKKALLLLANVKLPAPKTLKPVIQFNVPFSLKEPEMFMLPPFKVRTPPELIVIVAQAAAAVTVMGEPLFIVTTSPATGTCAGSHEAVLFQAPPAPVD